MTPLTLNEDLSQTIFKQKSPNYKEWSKYIFCRYKEKEGNEYLRDQGREWSHRYFISGGGLPEAEALFPSWLCGALFGQERRKIAR